MLPDTVRSAMAEVLGWRAPDQSKGAIARTPAPKPSVARVLVMHWPEPWLREQRWVGASR